MKNLKVYITVLIAFFCSSFLIGQKVLDKSGKRPNWVNGVVKDYIIVTASGETAESAQSNALLKVKERIISAVAENVQTSSDYYRGDKTENGISTFIENFETSTRTKSADIPYLKGISLSKAEEFYWEKVSENNKTRFYYHLKYPFSEMELKSLIVDFDMADKQLTLELEQIIDSSQNITSLEQISYFSLALQKMSKAFIDQRKEKADVNIARFNEMLKSVVLYPISNTLGEVRYSLKIGDKVVTTAAKPKVTSVNNCAKITEVLNNQTEWVIKYNYDGCFDDPANAIVVSYSMSPSMKNNFPFDVNANKAQIFLKGNVILTKISDQGSTVNAKCRMTVISKFNSPVTIDKITLVWNNYPPLVIDNFNKQIQGKGEHELVFDLPQAIDKAKCSASAKATINGNIQYRSVVGEKSTFNIYDQDMTTDW